MPTPRLGALLALFFAASPASPAPGLWVESALQAPDHLRLRLLPLSGAGRAALDPARARVRVDGADRKPLGTRPIPGALHLVLVLDHSIGAHTDRPTWWEGIRTLVGSTPVRTRATAVLSGDRPELVEGAPGRLRGFLRDLERRRPEAPVSRLGAALHRALDRIGEEELDRALVVVVALSDDPALAKPAWGESKTRKALLARVRGEKVPVFALTLGSEVDAELGKDLAASSGGIASHSWSGLSLRTALRRLAYGVEHGREVRVADDPPDGAPPRVVEVRIRGQEAPLLRERVRPAPAPVPPTPAPVPPPAPPPPFSAASTPPTSAPAPTATVTSVVRSLPIALRPVPRLDFGTWGVDPDAPGADPDSADLARRVNLRLGLLRSRADSSLRVALDRLDEARATGSEATIARLYTHARDSLAFLGTTYSATVDAIDEEVRRFTEARDRTDPDVVAHHKALLELRRRWVLFKKELKAWGEGVGGGGAG